MPVISKINDKKINGLQDVQEILSNLQKFYKQNNNQYLIKLDFPTTT